MVQLLYDKMWARTIKEMLSVKHFAVTSRLTFEDNSYLMVLGFISWENFKHRHLVLCWARVVVILFAQLLTLSALRLEAKCLASNTLNGNWALYNKREFKSFHDSIIPHTNSTDFEEGAFLCHFWKSFWLQENMAIIVCYDELLKQNIFR